MVVAPRTAEVGSISSSGSGSAGGGRMSSPPGLPGLAGFWRSFFCVHYGLFTWSMGGPVALAGAAAALCGDSFFHYALAVLVAVLVAAPYTLVRERWPRWNQTMIHRFTSSRAFAGASMREDPQHPVDFEDRERSPVLLAYHPHGVFCTAFSGSHGVLQPTLYEKGVLFLLAGPLYHMPLFRLFVVAMFGNIKDASKRSMEEAMAQRRHVALLPGGFEEASITEPGKERVYVGKRLGFVKLALRHGYTVHPIYSFGESSLYRTFVPSWLPFSVPVSWVVVLHSSLP